MEAEQLASAEQLHAMSAAGTLFVPPPLVEHEGDSSHDGSSDGETDDDTVGMGESDLLDDNDLSYDDTK